jgi:glyoxylase-like metal-dependent hydrolase (beta-lactamase superfamily II)
VYIAATRYKLQDYAPLLFRTADYGRTWTRITNGIPSGDFSRVIRADTVRRGLLFAGSETTVYVSFDDGDSWRALSLNLPRVPVYDLKVARDDLVAGTHGRGFWILDEITALRELRVDAPSLQVFAPQETVRLAGGLEIGPEFTGKAYVWNAGIVEERKSRDGRGQVVVHGAGSNPPPGVPVSYFLPHEPGVDEIELTVHDAKGALIATASPEADPPAKPDGEDAVPEPPKKRPWEVLPRGKGFNRFQWNMRYPGVRELPDDKGHRAVAAGPIAPPGRYEFRLRVGKQTLTTRTEIVPDPEGAASARDLRAQFTLLVHIRDTHNAAHDTIARIRSIRAQLEPVTKRKKYEDVAGAARDVVKKLKAIEDRLSEPKLTGQEAFLAVPAGVDAKLADLAEAEEESGIRSVALGRLGPPELSKLLFEAELLRHALETIEAVATALERRGVEPVHVVLTHIHLDHGGGVGHVAARFPNATIWVHDIGARHVADPSRLVASARRLFGDALDALYGEPNPVPEDRIVAMEEGTVIDLRDRELRVLYTPGHARHEVTLLDTTTRAAFVGDTAGVCYGEGWQKPATPPPEFDLDAALDSIARVQQLRPSTVCFTHFGPAREAVLEQAAADLKRWDSVLRLMAKSGASEDEMLAAIEPVAGRPPGDDAFAAAATELSSTRNSLLGYTRYYTKTFGAEG